MISLFPGTNKNRRRLFEGKTKILYEGPEPGTVIQYFKDGDATNAGIANENGQSGPIAGKGVLNNRISEYLMGKLNEIGVPTHFIRRLNMREQLIRQLEIIPIELVVRNYAAGSLVKRFGIAEGTQLPRSIIEFYLKSTELDRPMVTDEHITAFGWADPHDIEDMVMIALRVNDYLSGLFLGAGLKLVDFKLEFGRQFDEAGNVQIIVADEISPDNCRLWDSKTGEKLDYDRLRLGLGNVAEAYQEVAKRLGVFQDPAAALAEAAAADAEVAPV